MSFVLSFVCLLLRREVWWELFGNLFSAVTAFLGIFTTINEHIIETLPTAPAHVGPSGTDSSSLSYPLLISILKDLETVVEVAAEHFYGDKKWNFIILTEAMK